MASLTDEERNIVMPIIFKNKFTDIDELDVSEKIRKVLSYYKNYRSEIADPKSELYKLKREFERKKPKL